MTKTKEKLIADIIKSAEIHHNIKIRNWKRIPDFDGFDWDDEAQLCIDDFISDFRFEPMNDKGNRNLCGCNKVICTEADFKMDNGYNGRKYFDRYSRWIDLDEAKKLGIVDKRTSEDRSLFTENGACKKHDLWNVYQTGRSGATLYWDKYWNDDGRFNISEYDLEQMSMYDLKIISKEINLWNEKVAELMENFYASCESRVADLKAEKEEEETEEKNYQDVKKKVVDGGYIKRLVSEIL